MKVAVKKRGAGKEMKTISGDKSCAVDRSRLVIIAFSVQLRNLREV